MDVWASAPGTMTFQLESVSEGNKEVTRDIETGGAWQTISFDFSEFQAVDDWASMRLIFNPGVAEELSSTSTTSINPKAPLILVKALLL